MNLPTFPNVEDLKNKYFSAMAFDFGTQRIGSAYGQSITGTAEALSVIKARDGIPDWTVLEALVKKWQPALLVVGVPRNLDDSETELTGRAEKFARRLNGRLHLPCYGIDERLSSVAAEELRSSGMTKVGVDSLAAQIILETWFSELSRHRK